MVVKTKFNIGDRVWFVADNIVKHNEITGVSVLVDKKGTHISYTLNYDTDIVESELYETKEELLKSL